MIHHPVLQVRMCVVDVFIFLILINQINQIRNNCSLTYVATPSNTTATYRLDILIISAVNWCDAITYDTLPSVQKF